MTQFTFTMFSVNLLCLVHYGFNVLDFYIAAGLLDLDGIDNTFADIITAHVAASKKAS